MGKDRKFNTNSGIRTKVSKNEKMNPHQKRKERNFKKSAKKER